MDHKYAAQSILELVFRSEIFEIEQKILHYNTLKILLTNKIDYTDAFLQAKSILDNAKILSFDKDFNNLKPNQRIKI